MQQTAARVLGIAFIDKGEFETMQTPSGRHTLHYDRHSFMLERQ